MKLFTRLPRWLAGALILFTPVKAFAFPLILPLLIGYGAMGGIIAADTVVTHERTGQSYAELLTPCVFDCHPVPPASIPMPKAKPQPKAHAKITGTGPRPKSAPPLITKVAPTAPAVATEPPPLVPAHEEAAPEMTWNGSVVPEAKPAEESTPWWEWLISFLVIGFGAYLVVGAGRTIWTVYKATHAAKTIAAAINKGNA